MTCFRIPSTFLLLLLTTALYAQHFAADPVPQRVVRKRDYYRDTLQVFYDYHWQKTNKEQARYFTMAIKEGSLWYCWDYYVQERKIKSEGAFEDKELTLRTGLFHHYHPNGQTASQGKYFNGKKLGLWMEYDEAGNNTDSSFYINGFKAGKCWVKYSNGQPNALYDMDKKGLGSGYYSLFYRSRQLVAYGKYAEGMIKDSTWTYYYPDGQVSYIREYQKGDTLSDRCYDTLGREMDSCIALRDPQFKGEPTDKYIDKHLKWPEGITFNNTLQAKVVVAFTINTDGTMGYIRIIQSLAPAFDREVIRVLRSMTDWESGSFYNIPYPHTFVQTFTFQRGY